jgi:hypothetical protein
MKAGTETGSLMNHIMTNAAQAKPEVGMGCTLCGWTDRHAGTVVEIKSDRRIVVQQDIATRTDTLGMSDQQTYDYTPNPNGAKYVFFLNKRGQWKCKSMGYGLVLNTRREYYDFSF